MSLDNALFRTGSGIQSFDSRFPLEFIPIDIGAGMTDLRLLQRRYGGTTLAKNI